MDIHGVRFCYETGIYAGTIRLDAGFLHNKTSDSNSVKGALVAGFLATRRYKVHPYATHIHGVAHQYGLRLFLALSDSTPDSSTTRQPIPILSMGQYLAGSQLSNGICYISHRDGY